MDACLDAARLGAALQAPSDIEAPLRQKTDNVRRSRKRNVAESGGRAGERGIVRI